MCGKPTKPSNQAIPKHRNDDRSDKYATAVQDDDVPPPYCETDPRLHGVVSKTPASKATPSTATTSIVPSGNQPSGPSFSNSQSYFCESSAQQHLKHSYHARLAALFKPLDRSVCKMDHRSFSFSQIRQSKRDNIQCCIAYKGRIRVCSHFTITLHNTGSGRKATGATSWKCVESPECPEIRVDTEQTVQMLHTNQSKVYARAVSVPEARKDISTSGEFPVCSHLLLVPAQHLSIKSHVVVKGQNEHHITRCSLCSCVVSLQTCLQHSGSLKATLNISQTVAIGTERDGHCFVSIHRSLGSQKLRDI